MENKDLIVNTDELRTMLENNDRVIVLDVRPKEQREEWQIPGSIYVDAYKRLNANDQTVLDELKYLKTRKWSRVIRSLQMV